MFQSSRERPPYKVQRRLMGWMTSHDPADLYVTLDEPHHKILAYKALVYANSAPTSPLVIAGADDIDHRYVGQASDSFHQSLEDLTYLFRSAAQSPDTNLVDAAVLQTADFVQGVANYAQLPTDELSTYVHVQERALESGSFDLAQFQLDAYELVQEDERLKTRGCPFAKHDTTTERRDPLFDNFVRWGAQLSLHASPDLVTPELLAQATARLQVSGQDRA